MIVCVSIYLLMMVKSWRAAWNNEDRKGSLALLVDDIQTLVQLSQAIPPFSDLSRPLLSPRSFQYCTHLLLLRRSPGQTPSVLGHLFCSSWSYPGHPSSFSRTSSFLYIHYFLRQYYCRWNYYNSSGCLITCVFWNITRLMLCIIYEHERRERGKRWRICIHEE